MIVSLTCSWCHGITISTSKPPIYCITCHHRADLPRSWCDCGQPGCEGPRDARYAHVSHISEVIATNAADYFVRADSPEAKEVLRARLDNADRQKVIAVLGLGPDGCYVMPDGECISPIRCAHGDGIGFERWFELAPKPKRDEPNEEV